MKFDKRKNHMVTCSGASPRRGDCHREPLQVGIYMSLKSFSHAYGESNYHIVLVPKYRRKIFKDIHVARGCRLVLFEIASRYGYNILALEIMEDHVHLFLEMHPIHSLSRTFQLFKGISARKLFWRFPSLKKQLWGGHLWTKGKFFRSVGEVTSDKIEFYIKESQSGGIFAKPSQTNLNKYCTL
jgi:putative transposase